jgi:diaminopimelate epimerase
VIHLSYLYRLKPEEIAIRYQERQARADKACGDCANRSLFVGLDGQPAREWRFPLRDSGRQCDKYRKEGKGTVSGRMQRSGDRLS